MPPPSSRRSGNGATDDGSSTTSQPSVELEEQNKISEALTSMTMEIDRNDDSGDEAGDTENARITRKLKQNSITQKHLYETGKLVGEKGKPSQIVQDAHLSSRANIQAIPAIRSIRISRSVWHPKIFTNRLMSHLKNRCLDPEDQDVDSTPPMEDMAVASWFCQTFVEEFASTCAAGLVPDFNAVYGSISTAVTIRPKTPRKPQSQEVGKRVRDKDREAPQVVKKLMASEMDANVDPTMQRVTELRNGILELFQRGNQKPIDMMRLLINRESFQNTVQNFFCFSFLLKDNQVRMFLDDEQLPVCTPVMIPTDDVDEEGREVMEDVPDPTVNRAEENKFQTIMMNLTEAGWKEMVETFYGKDA